MAAALPALRSQTWIGSKENPSIDVGNHDIFGAKNLGLLVVMHVLLYESIDQTEKWGIYACHL